MWSLFNRSESSQRGPGPNGEAMVRWTWALLRFPVHSLTDLAKPPHVCAKQAHQEHNQGADAIETGPSMATRLGEAVTCSVRSHLV